MAGLPEQLEDVRNALEGVSADLSDAIRTINAEASEKIVRAVAAADAQRAGLWLRMTRLSVAANMLDVDAGTSRMELAVGGNPVADDDRRPATEIILEALLEARGPLPSKALDKLVMDHGWTRSAAEKSKTRLREAGAVIREDRHYTITEIGANRIGGEQSPK